jgi:small subunit ribosomal protein S7
MSKKITNSVNKNFHKKLVGFLTKEGKKSKAVSIVNSSFLLVSKNKDLSFSEIESRLIEKLNSFVEIKKVRIRRGSHMVPFPVNDNRRFYLMVKWLMQSVKEDKRKKPLSEKIAFEIEQTLKDSPSKSVKLKNLNIAQSISNRSNIHYRW